MNWVALGCFLTVLALVAGVCFVVAAVIGGLLWAAGLIE